MVYFGCDVCVVMRGWCYLLILVVLDFLFVEWIRWMDGGYIFYILVNMIYVVLVFGRFFRIWREDEVGFWLLKSFCCLLGLSFMVSFYCVKVFIVGYVIYGLYVEV